VDDNSAFLKTEVDLLSEVFEVVGTAVNGKSVVSAADELKPDVIVLDLSLGDLTGFEVARRLRSAGSGARIVFFTIHESEEFVQAAEHLGVAGYVFKSRASDDLTRAVLAASQGRRFFPPPGRH
jgi:DNA-binding NarL/FixJ family response regulator